MDNILQMKDDFNTHINLNYNRIIYFEIEGNIENPDYLDDEYKINLVVYNILNKDSYVFNLNYYKFKYNKSFKRFHDDFNSVIQNLINIMNNENVKNEIIEHF